MVSGAVTGKHAHYRFGYDEGRFSIFAGTEKEKGVALVSSRDSVREAERHLGGFRLKPGMLAIVCGVSHLPLLELLYEQQQYGKSKGGWILAFEADTELFKALKALRPEIFAEIAVIVPENVNVLSELVEKLDVENFIGYRVFENAAAIQLNPSFYANYVGDFKRKLASRFSDLFTRLEFEERWVFNALSKLPQMERARPVSSLFGLGKGAEALLVSTGPSLRKSLHAIKENPNRYFIVCADSAYRVLNRCGITPHLIFSLDSQAHTTKHFALLPQGKMQSYPILVTDAVANPNVAFKWQGELAISFTAQYTASERHVSPGCDFIEEENFLEGKKGIFPGDLQSGGSVATSIFDLLRLMDFDKIIFVGQDLAYTFREIHTPGTHHTDEWLSKTVNRLQPLENINERVLRRRHTKREVSLAGKTIVTDYILSLYRDWFSEAVKQMPYKVFNATVDGLTIEGAVDYRKKFHAQRNDNSGHSLNAKILENYLRQNKLSVNAVKLDNLSGRIKSALEKGLKAEPLSFLRYVGRRFQIKARRTPEMQKALLKKQEIKQHNFLKKLLTKLYHHV